MREEIKPIDRLFVRSWVYEGTIPHKSFEYTTSQDCIIQYDYLD
jgi:hypothetical protein